jgi:hypothetical protein
LLLEQIEKRRRPLPGWAAIRTPSNIYVEYYGPDQESVIFREHYDLSEDPYELRNTLADNDSSNDAGTHALRARLQEIRACTGTGCP